MENEIIDAKPTRGIFDRIIAASLRRRGLVLGGGLFLCGLGAVLYPKLRVDVLPNLNRPVVTVLAEAKGLAPEEVETLVLIPLESAINGAPGVSRLRSTSRRGIAMVQVEFDWGTDTYRNRRIVSERLARLKGELPRDVVPIMGPVSSIMGEIQLIGMHSREGKISSRQMRTIADWNIRKRLLAVRGVANVVVIGGHAREYVIRLNAAKLARRNIAPSSIAEWLRGLGGNTSGGFIEKGDKEFIIRNLGSFYNVSEIAQAVIGYHAGRPVRVKDVGEAVVSHRVRRGDAGINGKAGIILGVQKSPDASTLKLTRSIREILKSIERDLPEDIVLTSDLFLQASFINRAVDNVVEAIRDGSIIVAVVLFLFLWNARTTLITLTALPLSLIAAVVALHAFGFSINTMTIGGLTIAIGELVDDAIVDTENVFKRLKENAAAGGVGTTIRVVFQASSEIRNSIVLATLVVVLVFAPLFFLTGVEGRLFRPLALAYIFAIAASLFTALTITPVLCYYLLPGIAHRGREESFLARHLKNIQAKNLGFMLKHPRAVFGCIAFLFAAALALVPFLEREFLPPFNEGTLTLEVFTPAGTSLSASVKKAGELEKIIKATSGVVKFSRRTGRSEMDEHAEGVHYNELEIVLHPRADKSRVISELRKRFADVEGVAVNFGQPISHRLEHLLSGIKADAGIFIYGPKMDLLLAGAFKVRDALKKIPGVADVLIEVPGFSPELKISIRHDDAARYGIPVGRLTRSLESLLNGRVVGRVIEKQRIFNIRVRLEEAQRRDKKSIGNIVLKYLPDGSPVTVGMVADIYETTGPHEIKRENGSRRIVVQFNGRNRDMGALITNVETVLKKNLKLPSEYHYEIGGPYARRKQAMYLMVFLAALSFLLIALILYANFKSLAITGQILLNLPLAFIGGILALYLSGTPLSVASLIGFIALAGIASRNGILMISRFLNLMREPGAELSRELVTRGALDRLIPVLMTAVTAILALLPVLISGSDAPGKEILFPVALIIVCGLTSSTLLDLILTPVLFLHVTGKKVAGR